MKLIIEGTEKEIAALVVEIQERRKETTTKFRIDESTPKIMTLKELFSDEAIKNFREKLNNLNIESGW